MLQNIDLDTEQFEDIVEEAKKKISILCPEWTDYNYHDPGITIIELFAWLKEIQQYYINQTGIQNKDIFFKLLGITRRHKEPASVRIDVESDKTFHIPERSRFYAEDMIFETAAGKTILAGNISRMIMKNEEETRIISLEHLKAKGSFSEYPFGKQVKAGNTFYMLFEQALPSQTELSIFFNTLESTEVERNPIQHFSFHPLANLSYEYYTKDGFLPISRSVDETYGLIQDGSLFFSLQEEMEQTDMYGETGYFLKFEVVSEEYDISPCLVGVSANMLEAKQEETVFDSYEDSQSSFVGVGNGFSNQRFLIEDKDISYDSFEIMIAEQDLYAVWQKVGNFYHSASDDCHYVLQEDTGEIIFGDGIHGKCPSGEIRILRMKRTKGKEGNIRANTITGGTGLPQTIKVSNPEPAYGGKDSETVEDAINHFRRQLRKGTRLVTKEDYENTVKETPGLLIHSCKVIEQAREQNQVEIVVKPYSEDVKSKLSHAYKKNIYQYLEDKRMIGTKIQLLSPEYVEVALFADIFLKPQYANAKQTVEDAIKTFFQKRIHIFGLPLVSSEIFALLDKIDAVLKVELFSFATTNERVIINFQGDLILPSNAIALLSEIQFLYRA